MELLLEKEKAAIAIQYSAIMKQVVVPTTSSRIDREFMDMVCDMVRSALLDRGLPDFRNRDFQMKGDLRGETHFILPYQDFPGVLETFERIEKINLPVDQEYERTIY